MSLRAELKVTGVDGVLATLRSLPAELVSKRGGPVKLSLAKGARHLRDKVKAALEAQIKGGDESESTGLLAQSIISSRGKAPTSGKGERYLVRVKRKMYPGRKGEQVSTLKSAQIKEYGSEKQAAAPFIRPTAAAQAQSTVNIVTQDLLRRTDLLVKKLAAQNRGR